MEAKQPSAEGRPELQSPSESIGIVGANGQIGRFLLNELSQYPNLTLSGCVHKPGDIESLIADYPRTTDHLTDNLGEFMMGQPDTIFVATPNTEVETILKDINDKASKPTTVVLVHNGLVTEGQLAAIRNPNISLVRSSIFTVVSKDESGDITYDHDKRRIAFAAIPRDADEESIASQVDDLEGLFKGLGFETARFDKYQDMEWSKMLLNTIGTTAVVTGMTPEDTFKDSRLFHLECQGLADRLAIMKAAGRNLVDIPWISRNQLRLLSELSRFNSLIPTIVRNKIAHKIAKQRDNQPPSAARKIAEGVRPEEAPSYHQPFVDLARQVGLDAPIDESITEILNEHLNPGNPLNLRDMDQSDRRQLFLDRVTSKGR